MARAKGVRGGRAVPTVSAVVERRREEIAQVAVALFSERGYFQTTTDDIADRLGIGKGIIYRCFKDKNDVLLHALCVVLEQYKRGDASEILAAHGPLAALRRALRVHCEVAEEHTHEVVLAYRSTKDLMPEQRRLIKAQETRIVGDISLCLKACIRAKLMEPLDVRIVSYQYLMYGHAWALKNWALRKDYTAAEYAAAGERILIVPFLTPEGRKQYEEDDTAPLNGPQRAARP